MSFGALYIVFNSDYNEVCDYSDIVESCSELKTYQATDPAWEFAQLHDAYLHQAQTLRNHSEIEKCDLERDLLQELQEEEKTEAERIVRTCMENFKACVGDSYTTTKAPVAAVDCTGCNRFCESSKWMGIDPAYAAEMGFTGQCSAEVCPWLPECGDGNFIHDKCSKRGCPCEKTKCTTTTTTTVTTIPDATTTTVVTTTTTGPTTTSTTVTVTTVITTTNTDTTSMTTTSTATSTTATSTTTTTTTLTSTTTITTTITTTTLTTIGITTTGPTTTTTVTTVDCYCSTGIVGTVIVGRPHKTFYEVAHAYDKKTIEYWQGVYIETNNSMPLGGSSRHGCRDYFVDRSHYVGPRSLSGKTQQAMARASHFDLSCGYGGTFDITCGQSAAEKLTGQCSNKVDISTCTPPSYTQALDECYTVQTTTPRPTGPTAAVVPDWLGVEILNFSLAHPSPYHGITTQTTTPYPCCEVHVGSVCRPDQNFAYPAPTDKGRWQPHLSHQGKAGYFSMVPCNKQAENVPRVCPRVKIKELSTFHLQWPQCAYACSNAQAQANLTKMCNRTLNEKLEVMEQAAHKAKIASMTAKAATLESWVAGRMRTVKDTKSVVDCFADKLPRRYNALALPKMRSGFDKMPLDNQCRLHQCKANQCLEIKRTCKVPFVHEFPETMCNVFRPNGTFTCVDKITINSNNPMSLGFGIAWMVIGGLFVCAGFAFYMRQLSQAGHFNGQAAQAETTALARPGGRQ